LIDYGIAPERIKVSGMPVHPKFSFPAIRRPSSRAPRWVWMPTSLPCSSTPVGKAAVNIPNIFRELVRGELDMQAIFLAGKNEALKSEAETLAAEAKFPIKVIGYSDEVEKLLARPT